MRTSGNMKEHLEDGDKLVWYKDDNIVATWHSNGRVDIGDKKDVSMCEATFYASKGKWRETEHGVGKEPNHWLFNGVSIKEIQNTYKDFWNATEKVTKQKNVPRKNKETTENNYEVVKVDISGWELLERNHYEKIENIASSLKCFRIKEEALREYKLSSFESYTRNSGVYILLKDNNAYYAGEGNDVLYRVSQHLTDRHEGRWDTALLFVHCNNDFSKDYQDTLEWLLIKQIRGRGSGIEISEKANKTWGNPQNAKKVYNKRPNVYDEIIQRIQESSSVMGYDFLIKGYYKNAIKNNIGTSENKFAKKDSKTSVISTPKWVVEEMVRMLPEWVFGPDVTIFDPAIKDGGFLQSCYERSMKNKELRDKFKQDEKRISYYIKHNKLFGIIQKETNEKHFIDIMVV